jgi:hypothetical protein
MTGQPARGLRRRRQAKYMIIVRSMAFRVCAPVQATGAAPRLMSYKGVRLSEFTLNKFFPFDIILVLRNRVVSNAGF